MKRSLLSVVCVCAWVVSSAQIEKGRWLVGGNTSYSSSRNNSRYRGISGSSKSTSFVATPRVGYFFINNLTGGLSISYTSSQSTIGSGVGKIDNASKGITISPFARYYFKRIVFAQAEYGLGTSSSSITPSPTPEREFNVKQWSFALGYVLFVNDYVGTELLLGQKSSVFNEKGGSIKNTSDEFFINLGLQVYLGRMRE